MSASVRETQSGSLPLGTGLVGAKDKAKAAKANLMVRARKMRLAWRIILIVALICLASIIWLSQTSTIVSIGYEMETLDKKMAVMNRQAEAMQSQIAVLEHPRQIEKEAREKLGMVDAAKFVYVPIAATPEDNTPTSNNPKLAPVSEFWRDLVKLLPRPWYGSAPSR